MSLNSNFHLRCRKCAFVVHDQYFLDKIRFTPGVCPNCGGLVDVCVAYQDTPASGYHLGVDPGDSRTYRRVVPNVEVAP